MTNGDVKLLPYGFPYLSRGWWLSHFLANNRVFIQTIANARTFQRKKKSAAKEILFSWQPMAKESLGERKSPILSILGEIFVHLSRN